MVKKIILLFILLFAIYALLYLPDNNHLLFIVLFIPICLLVLKELFKKEKK